MNREKRETLERMLRADGRRDTPAFSIPLHQRSLEALRQAGLPQRAARPASRSGVGSLFLKVGLPLAAAAAIAVVAWIALNQPPVTPAPRERTPVAMPPLPNLQNPVTRSPEADVNDARFAYLDRDAMKFWTFLANQLPELPEPKP